jgi:DNA-binding NarL/FixJ family response regulator
MCAGSLETTFEIIAAVQDAQSRLSGNARLKLDVLIIGISTPILNGIEVAQQLRESGCREEIVFLTLHDDPVVIRASFAAGAMGHVNNSRIAMELVLAVREPVAERIFNSSSLSFRE